MRVLLITNNEIDALSVRQLLAEVTQESFAVEWASRLPLGLHRLGEGRFEAVVLDLGVSESQGLDAFDKVLAAAPGLPTVVLGTIDDEATGFEAVRKGAQDYLVKEQIDGSLMCRVLRFAAENP